MTNRPDTTVGAALDNDGYVVLPVRHNGDPGDPVTGFDAAGSVTLVVLVDGVDLVDGAPGTIDVLVESSADGGDSWDTVNDFSDLTHADSPDLFLVTAPAAQLRATLTGTAKHVEVRAFPHGSTRSAAVLADGVFTNVTKPSVSDATAPALLAALVTLGLVTDDT
jgi:hypothetical protein